MRSSPNRAVHRFAVSLPESGSALENPTHSMEVALARFIVLSGLALLACSSESNVASTALPLRDSTESTASEDSAVAVLINGERGCTGVLVSPTLVLSAKHCLVETVVDSANPLEKDCALSGNALSNKDLLVQVGPMFAAPRKVHAVRRVFVDDAVGCGADLGALELEEPVEPSIELPSLRLDQPVLQDEPILVVGWGTLGSVAPPYDWPATRRRQQGTVLSPTGVVPGHPVPTAGVVALSTQACVGDSGAPVWSHGVLVGIVSSTTVVDQVCTAPTYAVSIAHNRERIEQWFRATGRMPTREGLPPPAALFDPCTQNNRCNSNLCARVGESQICTTTCATNADCGAHASCLQTRQGPLVCVQGDGTAIAQSPSCASSPIAPRSDRSLLALGIALFVALRRRRVR
jgi:Trypsin